MKDGTSYDKNEIAEGNTGLDKAYAIRCIRK